MNAWSVRRSVQEQQFKTLQFNFKYSLFNNREPQGVLIKLEQFSLLTHQTKRQKIDYKCYKIWYKLNENARISVKTSVVESKSKIVKDSIGQGQLGASLVRWAILFYMGKSFFPSF